MFLNFFYSRSDLFGLTNERTRCTLSKSASIQEVAQGLVYSKILPKNSTPHLPSSKKAIQNEIDSFAANTDDFETVSSDRKKLLGTTKSSSIYLQIIVVSPESGTLVNVSDSSFFC